jgi:ATP-dependent Lon protease
MTGEITLRGKVLPVGGIKEKMLAARRANLTDIILSKENKKDIEEIKADYIAGLTFHYIDEMKEIRELALLNEKVKNPLELNYQR